MILTKEQSEKRLNSDKNIVNQSSSESIVIFKDGKNHVGRPGSTNLTDEEKVSIGVLANLTGNELAADIFGVSPNTARHLKTGQTTESNGRDTQQYSKDQALTNAIKERLDKTRLTVEERAAEVLLSSMGLITPDKLENSSAKELSQITNQMSQVVRNMRGPSSDKERDAKQNVKVVIMQPKTSQESSFDVIEIGVG